MYLICNPCIFVSSLYQKDVTSVIVLIVNVPKIVGVLLEEDKITINVPFGTSPLYQPWASFIDLQMAFFRVTV